MRPSPVNEFMQATYVALRWGIALLGIALPWVLWIGGHVVAGLGLQESMSAYYHTAVRDAFVGLLFAVSILLVVYRGYSWLEYWVLNLGGLFLAGVALFPMQMTCVAKCSVITMHGSLAVLFFICIAYVCVFRASDTLALMASQARAQRFRLTYRVLGAMMIVSPAIAVLLSYVLQPFAQSRSIIFFIECVGVYVFCAYWIVKSYELKLTGVESLAAQGHVVSPPLRMRDLFREASVRSRNPAESVTA